MKTLYQILFIAVILSGIGGCSLVGGLFGGDDELLEADRHYREAVKAFKEKKYKKSTALIREIEPDSPVYPKGIQLLQKIPMQRAQDAIQAKNYPLALRQLNKISEENSNYRKAQQLKGRVVFQFALSEYDKAKRAPQKVRALAHLTDVAIESKKMENVLQTIDIIGDQLKQSKQPQEIKTLIRLLESTIEKQRNTDILHAGLEQSFLAYNQFNQQVEHRDQLLRLIAKVKMKLQ